MGFLLPGVEKFLLMGFPVHLLDVTCVSDSVSLACLISIQCVHEVRNALFSKSGFVIAGGKRHAHQSHWSSLSMCVEGTAVQSKTYSLIRSQPKKTVSGFTGCKLSCCQLHWLQVVLRPVALAASCLAATCTGCKLSCGHLHWLQVVLWPVALAASFLAASGTE